MKLKQINRHSVDLRAVGSQIVLPEITIAKRVRPRYEEEEYQSLIDVYESNLRTLQAMREYQQEQPYVS